MAVDHVEQLCAAWSDVVHVDEGGRPAPLLDGAREGLQ
jgi:hypothetical protein